MMEQPHQGEIVSEAKSLTKLPKRLAKVTNGAALPSQQHRFKGLLRVYPI
jgi:hypothetical protein